MRVDVFDTAREAAIAAARAIAADARAAILDRGRFIVAFSGGRTPAAMLQALAQEDVPWADVHVLQVDERVAPAGHDDRNLTGLREHLTSRVAIPAGHIHAMPVETNDPESATAEYARRLSTIAGDPPVIDLVHLGLGSDGHTASLLPGDAALDVHDRDIAMSGVYQGRRRMTMTLPMLERARRILWVVTGADKAAMLARLLERDPSIPAGRVSQRSAHVIADRASHPHR